MLALVFVLPAATAFVLLVALALVLPGAVVVAWCCRGWWWWLGVASSGDGNSGVADGVAIGTALVLVMVVLGESPNCI